MDPRKLELGLRPAGHRRNAGDDDERYHGQLVQRLSRVVPIQRFGNFRSLYLSEFWIRIMSLAVTVRLEASGVTQGARCKGGNRYDPGWQTIGAPEICEPVKMFTPFG